MVFRQHGQPKYFLCVNLIYLVLNEPLRVKKAPAGGSSQVNTSVSQVSQDVVDQLMQFGFSEKKVRKALAATVITLY